MKWVAGRGKQQSIEAKKQAKQMSGSRAAFARDCYANL